MTMHPDHLSVLKLLFSDLEDEEFIETVRTKSYSVLDFLSLSLLLR